LATGLNQSEIRNTLVQSKPEKLDDLEDKTRRFARGRTSYPFYGSLCASSASRRGARRRQRL